MPATILRERCGISAPMYDAPLVYAAISTVVPSSVLARPIDFDTADFHGPPLPTHLALRQAANLAGRKAVTAAATIAPAVPAPASRRCARPGQRDLEERPAPMQQPAQRE